LPDQSEQLEALLHENRLLRTRVAELERAASRFGAQPLHGAPNESLSEREALLLEAERIAHMGSWVWDINTNQVFWSDELFRILGYDPNVEQPSVEAFFAALHPDDVARIQAQSQTVATTGIAEQGDCRVVWRDGSIRRVSLSGASMFDKHGVLRRVVGTVLDVTSAKHAAEQTERALLLLAEAQRIAQVGSWVLDLRNKKLEWSAQMCHILGVPEDTVATEAGFLERVHPDDRDRLAQIHNRALAEGTGEGEARLVRPDGGVRHVYIVGKPLRDSDGKIIELRGTLLDVTRRVELEEQLLRAQKLEALGRLSGGIAHDFNNLLTVILANVDLLQRQITGKPLLLLRQVEQASELAAELTRQLLAFGRRAHLAPRAIVLNALIPDALNMTRRLVRADIALRSELQPDLWPCKVDVAQIQQILINLLVNARDALPKGGTVTVSTRNRVIEAGEQAAGPQAGEYVELSVHDTGSGMDPTTRARIFEPFFTTKGEGQGSGLGLAVVFGAVAQHGGSITVESETRQGTTFRIYLPRCTEAPESAERRGPKPADASDQGRILVVEDDPSVAMVMQQALSSAGFEVIVATRPSEATARWQQGERFDLLVSDVVMPEMRGPLLVQELTRIGPAPRVLFVTGYGPELFGDAAQQRQHPVLEKPFNTQALLDAVRALLSTPA